jgi:hypothetical protein
VAPDGARAQIGSLTIPSHILNSFPDFWKIISRFIDLIRRLVNDDPRIMDNEFKFLLQYHELLELREKTNYFRAKQAGKINLRIDPLHIAVRRNSVLNDSYPGLRNVSAERLRSRLHVRFDHEPGIDQGGLTREWFELLAKDLFNVNYGLFKFSKNMRSSQPHPSSAQINDGHLGYFRFAGLIIARAMIEGVPIDAHLTTAFLKHILNRTPSLRDLEEVDPEVHKSMKWLQEHKVTSELGLDFSATDGELDADRLSLPIENCLSVLKAQNYYLSLHRSLQKVDARWHVHFFQLPLKDVTRMRQVCALRVCSDKFHQRWPIWSCKFSNFMQ